MAWKGVTVSEQRQRFLEDYELNYCSATELAERFGISRTTAHKWISGSSSMATREFVLKLLHGAIMGILIGLLLIALVDRQPGFLLLEIELPPIFAPNFNA